MKWFNYLMFQKGEDLGIQISIWGFHSIIVDETAKKKMNLVLVLGRLLYWKLSWWKIYKWCWNKGWKRPNLISFVPWESWSNFKISHPSKFNQYQHVSPKYWLILTLEPNFLPPPHTFFPQKVPNQVITTKIHYGRMIIMYWGVKLLLISKKKLLFREFFYLFINRVKKGSSRNFLISTESYLLLST